VEHLGCFQTLVSVNTIAIIMGVQVARSCPEHIPWMYSHEWYHQILW
jgi:hypothetical protein